MLLSAIVIVSALGPLPFGYAFDKFGGYKEIILMMMIFPVLGIGAALISPKPIKAARFDNKHTL